MNEFKNILKIIIRIGVGLFFIVSAVLKLLSLDSFELYIYSFNIVNFPWSGLVARGIIACELLVGILLIIKVKYKWAWWFAILMLVGFSFLLVYVILFRNDSNCHCMGDLVQMRPSVSLIKNIVAIALLMFVRKEEDYSFRWRKLALALSIVAAIVPPFAMFPTDNVYNLFSRNDGLNYDEAEFNALMADSSMQDVHVEEGNFIVGVISSGCPHCKTGCLKLSDIVEHNQIDTSRVMFFVWGDSASVSKFKEETQTEGYRYVPINPLVAVRINNGLFPNFLYLKDGNVIKTADIKQLTEKSICDHLR